MNDRQAGSAMASHWAPSSHAKVRSRDNLFGGEFLDQNWSSLDWWSSLRCVKRVGKRRSLMGWELRLRRTTYTKSGNRITSCLDDSSKHLHSQPLRGTSYRLDQMDRGYPINHQSLRTPQDWFVASTTSSSMFSRRYSMQYSMHQERGESIA